MPIGLRMLMLSLAPAVGLGFGRFAYALILPEMHLTLHWTYYEAGWLNASNAIGYVIGALIAIPLSRHLKLWPVVLLGMWGTAVTLFLTGLTEHFLMLNIWRALTGTFGAFCLVGGGVIAAAYASEHREKSGIILGFFYGGTGIGISLSGFIVPGLQAEFGVQNWAYAWYLLGALGGVCTVITHFAQSPIVQEEAIDEPDAPPFQPRKAAFVLAAYFLFGAGYIGYMTFIFALLKKVGTSPVELSLFWILLGLAVIVSPLIWKNLLLDLRHGYGMAFFTCMTLIASAIPLITDSFYLALVSGILFGLSFMIAVASTTQWVRRNLAECHWTYAVGIFTIAFGIGQSGGPLIAGLASEQSDSLHTGLMWGVGMLLLSVILACLQKDADER